MIQRLHAIPEGTGIMYRWRNIQTNQELDRVMGFIGVVSDAAVYIDFSNHCLLAHIKVLRPSGETLGELYSTSEEEVKLAVAGKIERICDDHRLAIVRTVPVSQRHRRGTLYERRGSRHHPRRPKVH